jgi:hypothetical protein
VCEDIDDITRNMRVIIESNEIAKHKKSSFVRFINFVFLSLALIDINNIINANESAQDTFLFCCLLFSHAMATTIIIDNCHRFPPIFTILFCERTGRPK